MSLNGEINKYSGEIGRLINQIARRGMTDRNGVIKGTDRIIGYVCAINEEGDLAGTVDVQEFNYEADEYTTQGAGHHKGVLLSAIQDNSAGFLIVPQLYSEVVIVRSPLDGLEYVTMYSHARRIQLLSHSLEGENDGEIEIGVTETEQFVETDDGLDKDYFELEPTKNKTNTKYTATTITDQITSPDDEEGFKEEKTVAHKIISVGNTKIIIDGENIQIDTSGKISFTIGGTTITEEDGSVNIKTDNATVESSSCEIKGKNVKVEGTSVAITGGTLTTKGVAGTDLNGPFNAIKVCPFSGAPHCGSSVSGT